MGALLCGASEALVGPFVGIVLLLSFVVLFWFAGRRDRPTSPRRMLPTDQVDSLHAIVQLLPPCKLVEFIVIQFSRHARDVVHDGKVDNPVYYVDECPSLLGAKHRAY